MAAMNYADLSSLSFSTIQSFKMEVSNARSNSAAVTLAFADFLFEVCMVELHLLFNVYFARENGVRDIFVAEQ